MTPVTNSTTPNSGPVAVTFRAPEVGDAARLWEIARDSQVLDLNSSYSYLLWCRDFHDSSVVADHGGRVGGFVTGFVRPQDPRTVFVWQVAVDEELRGHGLAASMLNHLLDHLARQGVTRLETTISPDNTASQALFTALARTRYTSITRQRLFEPNHFPDQHESEELYIIGDH
ncbi:diaminobutyrate acetyltransferase [Rhodococcus spelaei]|uniref:L-2,4-diaminobutyric acid acetyltransferase n=1 Tax=Rhodococcus spelaei TaxID=2546320 RepID=A0A541BM85_9NOCA|nr:diaminobutyrate acetyltransferase [Rhodococcus spelaei]TQF73415.1 diaminobutyrate acetyltransferase [Rhodococcus spelaei]